MSHKCVGHLNKVADLLEKVALQGIIGSIIFAAELVAIDLAFGKSWHRKRGPRPRPIIHRTYNRTIIYRPPVPSERLHIVKSN
jgi:hypothetical protein